MVVTDDKFRSLEEDYLGYKHSINSAINEVLSGDGGHPQDVGRNAQSHVVEAQRIIKMMNMEARGKDPETRKLMLQKTNMYREELQAMQIDLERALLMSRESVARGPSAGELATSNNQKLMKTTERLKMSSATLEQSRRMVAETEEIGINVLGTLSEQRESLLASREKVNETKTFTADARRVLKRMSQKMLTDKIILWSVVGILSLSICAVIYYDFIKPSKNFM